MTPTEKIPRHANGGRARQYLAITWLGHATVLIELEGIRILTDPLLRGRVGPLVRVAPPPPDEATVRIDAVLLSHLHADHADVPSLRQIPDETPLIAPAGAGRWLARRGIENVTELAPGGETQVGSLRVTATAAVHDGRRRPLGARATPIGFVVAGGAHSVYFAGDTDLFAAMGELAGSIDVALLPVWGWGRSVRQGHLDPDRATTAAGLIAPAVAVPIHWGTYELGWRRHRNRAWPAMRFAELVAQHAPPVDVRVLGPGERSVVCPRSGGESR